MRYLQNLYSNLFLNELSPEKDHYRIMVLKVLIYCLIPILIIEMVVSFILGFYDISIIELICLVLFFILSTRTKKFPHVFGNIFIVLWFSISVVTSLNSLEHPAILLFFAIMPVFMFFFLGLKKGAIWITFNSSILLVSGVKYYLRYDHLAWETSYFIMSLVVFLYSLIITIAYEKTNQMLLQELQRQAYVDELTQIFNRRKFLELLRQDIQRSQRYGLPLSLAIVDIDYFKSVNDNYGHDTGDLVLQETSSVLQNSIRRTDILARYGGEEFIILFTETSIEKAVVVAEKIRKSIETYKYSNIDCCTISIGVTSFFSCDTETKFIKRADMALYKAKENGRNRVEALPA